MAIVVQSDRFRMDNPNLISSLGPGSYEPKNQFSTKKNYNPFNSTSQRHKNKKRVREVLTPGPGSYNVVKDPFDEKVKLLPRF